MPTLTFPSNNINLSSLMEEIENANYVGFHMMYIIDFELKVEVLDTFTAEVSIGELITSHKSNPANSDIARLKASKIAEFVEIAESEIANGFTSNALGDINYYSSGDADQLNLVGAVAMDSDLLYASRNTQESESSFKLHTAAQMRQVLIDGAIFKQSILTKNATKKYLVGLATTVDEVDAVTW